MEETLTIDHKIELLKIAAKATASTGEISGKTKDVIESYNQLIKAIFQDEK